MVIIELVRINFSKQLHLHNAKSLPCLKTIIQHFTAGCYMHLMLSTSGYVRQF